MIIEKSNFIKIDQIMHSTWHPIQDAMVEYCERFFSCINQWRSYENEEILENRILLVATLCKMFHEDVLNENIIDYRLESDIDYLHILLPEYIPQASNDVEAFQIVKQIVSYDYKIFRSVGFYFQENLLKALAGWSPEMLAKSNKKTRENLIKCVLKLFRLPESAGVIRIRRVVSINSNENTTIVPLLENVLKPDDKDQSNHYILYKFLLKSREEGYVPQLEPPIAINFDKNDQRKMHNRDNNSFDKNSIDNNDETNRVTQSGHFVRQGAKGDRNTFTMGNFNESLITIPKINSQQLDNNKSKINQSTPNKLENKLKHEKLNWGEPETLIGIKVLQYFKTGKRKTPFVGEVVSYDDFWHITWEDGDECDYDQTELHHARQLFLKHQGYV